MASITMESSYQSTNKDMGENHVKAHANQHKYQLSDEPNIETLTSNAIDEQSTALALKFAQENMGLMKPMEWFRHNQSLRKSRRKNNYTEYLLGVSANFRKAKQRRLDNPKTPKKTREKISREMHAIIDNAGIPIDGALYYLSNTEIYDNLDEKQLANYRKFEAKTLKKFYDSRVFRSLNPENIRAEIHYDENGAIHLQTQNIWFHRDKRGRLTYAKRAIIGNKLSKWYGGQEALQNRLDVLCLFEETAKKSGKKIGTKRADSMFNEYLKDYPWGKIDGTEKKNKDGSTRKYKYSSAERNTRLEELWRIEQINELGKIAEDTAKEFGINYHVSKTYATDGVHLDGAAYIAHKEAKQKNTEAIAKVQKVQKVAEAVSKDVKNTYKELSGQEALSEPLSATAKKIKNLNNSTKKEVNENQNLLQKQKDLINRQNQQIHQQQQQLLNIQQQNKKLNDENKQLKQENSRLKQIIETLRKRTRSAGLIISHWIKKHWDKLDKPLNDYAQNMSSAQNERLYGGSDGKGDLYTAKRYAKRAKDSFIAGITKIENDEWDKSGFDKVIKPSATSKSEEKDTDLYR